jgi:hypothetical protein
VKDGGNWYAYCLNNPIIWIDPDGHYNRKAAADFARNYSSYRKWIGSERIYFLTGNCTNFVSTAMHEGGIAENDEWYFNWAFQVLIWAKGEYSEVWTVAEKHYDYFSNPKNGFINGDVITINSNKEIKDVADNMGVQIGDLLYLVRKDEAEPYHLAIITKIDNGEIYYSGMTNSRSDAPLSKHKAEEEKALVVKIKDDA